MTKIYITQLVNSGNRYFVHQGRQLNICTISSSPCLSEKDSINDLLKIIFSKDSIFGDLYVDFLEEKTDIISELNNQCEGEVSKLNECFPDPECGTGMGESFCFEVKEYEMP